MQSKMLAVFAAACLASLCAGQEAEVQRVQVNGAELAYVERGQGEPVVLVHGSLLDHRVWAGPLHELSQHYRVIAYSRRHYRPNPPPAKDSELSVATHTEDLAELIQGLKLGPAHVIGHSAGAAIALQLAREHPELTASLVLAEPGPPVVAGSPLAGQGPPPFLLEARQAFLEDDNERAVRIITAGVTGSDFFDQMPPELRAMLLDNAPAMKAEMLSASPPSLPQCEELGELRPPSLLVVGEQSPDIFHMTAKELLGCLRQAEQAVIPAASHGLYLDNLAGFTEAVLAFLQQNRRAD